jgi:alpha-galactosidase
VDDKNGVRIVAGQELTHLTLKPGEAIRAPLIALLFWHGADEARAQNLWRRWFMAHNIPRIGGKPPAAMAQAQLAPTCKGSEEEQWREAKIFAAAGIEIDLYWNDAGWYPCNGRWANTGTWEVDAQRFPKGFKPIADWIHARGKKLIVWFEPERVGDTNSWLATNHPEWLLGSLLNLGHPEAWKWTVERIDGIIRENGIDHYRQDFNMDPLGSWRKGDAPDRQGITENLHVQGYLALWDELRRRRPGMLIDSCASGGQRNDLETLRRSVPLLRSDFQPAKQWEAQHGQTYGLSSWIPYYGSGVYSVEKYPARSFYMPCFGIGGDQDMKKAKAIFAECRQVAPLMLGDYYPLTSYSLKLDDWIAWQFDRPEQGDGVVQAFRRDQCVDDSKTFTLRGLDPNAQYKLTHFDVEGVTQVAGKALMEKGLTVEIKDKPGAAVIVYKRVQGG